MKLFVLTHGDHEATNIVGIFSSAEKAAEFVAATKVNTNVGCLEFELDPVVPAPYTKGLAPWSVIIETSNGRVQEAYCVSVLGRVRTEESVALNPPNVFPEYGEDKDDDWDVNDDSHWGSRAQKTLHAVVWATSRTEAIAQAMAYRTVYLSSGKKRVLCTKCSKPTNRIECELMNGFEAEHTDCTKPNWLSVVCRKEEAPVKAEIPIEAGCFTDVKSVMPAPLSVEDPPGLPCIAEVPGLPPVPTPAPSMPDLGTIPMMSLPETEPQQEIAT